MGSRAGRAVTYATIAATSLIMPWEGLSLTVRPDKLAQGLLTGCYGMTTYDRPLFNGERFTRKQCEDFLVVDIPTYYAPIAKCVHAQITEHNKAALVSAGYNAGSKAVCQSPMVAAFNRGDDGCLYFPGWHVTSVGKDGRQVRKGLVNRRNDEKRVCEEAD